MRGRRPCGLSRLRQTQENRKIVQRTVFRKSLRFRSGRSWARATGTQDPSSGGAGARWAPFSADRAGRRDFLGGPTARRGLPQARLPCPRKRVPSFGTSGRKGQARCHRDRSRGYRLRRVRPARCTFPPAAPVKAVELCSTPRKLLKKFDQNFSLSLPHPSATPYTMRNKGWLNSTTWPLPTQISATVPSTSAGISFISFMASIMHRVSPFFTWSPTSTKGRASGPGAE